MKRIFSLVLICSMIFVATSCKDDDGGEVNLDYSVTVNSPSIADKKVGDSIHLHVDFESGTREPVHHVNVRIYNVDTKEEVYNAPGEAHVHEMSGKYEWHDDFELIETNGVSAHSDWILEAKVWGHEAGMGEIVEMIEFHVHPQ